MEMNALPKYDRSDRSTGCCYRFNPEGWDGQEIHLKDKMFLRAETKSILHIPTNMGKVMPGTYDAIENSGAMHPDQFVVLSRELSPWKSEHLFLVDKEVPGQEMVRMSGDFISKVFEGPFNKVKDWHDEMLEPAEKSGRKAEDVYFFYTSCPRCAKAYGHSYVVAFTKLEPEVKAA